MNFTNNTGLPEALVNAIIKDEYDRGNANISITELLKPPLMVQLERRYDKQIVVDVADSVWALLGSSVHYMLEKGSTDKVLSEERMYARIGDWTISGQIDWFNESIMQDYKVTSVWNVVFGSAATDWKEQINYYNWLASKNGFKNINKLQVCAILRDWKISEAKRDQNYPQYQVKLIDIVKEDLRKVEHDLRNRVQLHMHAETQDIKDIFPCTPDEKWETPTKYALMKNKNKRAVKVCSTPEEAEILLGRGHKGATHIETRPGECKRCNLYCKVSSFCPVYNK